MKVEKEQAKWVFLIMTALPTMLAVGTLLTYGDPSIWFGIGGIIWFFGNAGLLGLFDDYLNKEV